MRKNEIKQIKRLFEDMNQEWADVEKAESNLPSKFVGKYG